MSSYLPYIKLYKKDICQQMNQLASVGTPFLFIVDYKAENGYVIKLDELDENFIRFQINEPMCQCADVPIKWEIEPLSEAIYSSKFNYVQEQIHQGNSFLTNLTLPTKVSSNLSLLDLFQQGSAKYKLWFNNYFTVLSPETFIKIEGQQISSFPMKGTIDAAKSNAEAVILSDPKEKAEHATIVDLIRNDLSLVASDVEVKRYRYVEQLTTNKQDLLQVSSEITGTLPTNYRHQLGDMLFKLLPAGSICGAPKSKTLEIIAQAEGYDRGFYTGVFGVFDGKNLDSAVMIRFVEQQGDELVFKSGGGITAQSDMKKEYEELIQKVYVPIS